MKKRLRAMAAVIALSISTTVSLAVIAPLAQAAAPSTALQISAGFGHTCALTGPNGAAKCWGRNDYGELGTGSTTSSYTPVGVLGLSSKVAAVSAGGSRSCALTTAGALRCWGTYPGNGTTSSLSPVSVPGLTSGVKAVSAGGTFTCALTTAGGVRCWGFGTLGQLGDGLSMPSSVPVTPVGLEGGVASISAGAQHACALMTSGAVRCWGYNAYGETGEPIVETEDPYIGNTATSTVVTGLPAGVTSVSAGGYHTCVTTSAGEAWCWGQDQYGQLGDGATLDRASAAPVTGLSGITAITAGTYHTCALAAGAPFCWGANESGEVGDGSFINRLTPTPVIGLISGVTQITAGRFHTCTVDTSGNAKCWGNNIWGQLGDGTTTTRSTPLGVRGFSR